MSEPFLCPVGDCGWRYTVPCGKDECPYDGGRPDLAAMQDTTKGPREIPRSPDAAARAVAGMELRDYFAAHAPAEYASWYTPTMPPRPEPLFDHDHPNAPQCQRDPYFDCRAVNAEELSAYDDERRGQYERQWPYAWADAMLEARKP